jgi:hypothetical protein
MKLGLSKPRDRLRVIGNRLVRGIFEHKREELTDYRKS